MDTFLGVDLDTLPADATVRPGRRFGRGRMCEFEGI